MIRREDVYKIGRLGKPHGVKGEISFKFSDDIFDRTDADYLILDIDGILVPFFFDDYRFHGNETALMKFCNIDTQEKAQELTGCDVFFPIDEVECDDNTFMSYDFILGFKLIDDKNGKAIGRIKSVDDSTINILFEVCDEKENDILIPASVDLIKNIDKEHKTINIDLPDGILDL